MITRFRERVFPSSNRIKHIPQGLDIFPYIIITLVKKKKKSIKICVKQLLWENEFGSSPAQIHSFIQAFRHA